MSTTMSSKDFIRAMRTAGPAFSARKSADEIAQRCRSTLLRRPSRPLGPRLKSSSRPHGCSATSSMSTCSAPTLPSMPWSSTSSEAAKAWLCTSLNTSTPSARPAPTRWRAANPGPPIVPSAPTSLVHGPPPGGHLVWPRGVSSLDLLVDANPRLFLYPKTKPSGRRGSRTDGSVGRNLFCVCRTLHPA